MKTNEIKKAVIINRFILNFGALLVLISLLAACGGGSSGGNDDEDNTNNLIIYALDNTINKTGLKDVYVTLYKPDNKAIQKTIKTADDGIANFGDMTNNQAAEGDGRVTISVAYQNSIPDDDDDITTVFDILPGNYTIYLKNSDCQSKGKVSLSYDGIDDAATIALVQPLNESNNFLTSTASVDNGTATFTNIAVCASNIQEDKRLSHLVVAMDDDNQMLSYGYTLDQDFSNGASYTGSADLTPVEVMWSTNDDNLLVDSVNYMAMRKFASPYMLGIFDFNESSEPASSGNLLVASQFPADLYAVLANQGSGTMNVKTMLRQFDTFDPNVIIEFTENEFTEFSYSSASKTFNWLLIGNADKDMINVSAKFSAMQEITWRLMIKPDALNLTLPDLPTEVQAWFDRDNIVSSKTRISSENSLSLSDFDKYFETISAANSNPLINLGSTDSVERILNGDIGTGTGTGTGLGNSNAKFGSVSSSSASSDGNFTFNSIIVQGDESIGISWLDVNSAVFMVLPYPEDLTKANVVTVTAANAAQFWFSSDTESVVKGVTISGNKVSFDNVVLESIGIGTSSITLNGELTF